MPKSFFLIWVWCICPWLMQAQEREPQDSKVGLVLSGGGAKGMAHIGALKVIEEAGVKIDYVGGTSMGAIVGALYAAGYSATELDSIFRAVDFGKLIQDLLPRDAKTFYEKENSERYALTLPFNNFKVSFPSAYSRGQGIYNELVRLLYPVKDIQDFSELPIPFLCIAANIETGKEVVLDHGYLPEAVMASGALPSLFEPADVAGKLLIDGGVVNNYPIDEVRKMGADIIIGVDVQHGLADREGLNSATEILSQINNFRTVRDMEEKSKQTDIYIKPDMEDFSIIDFNKREGILKQGEEAAREMYTQLKELSVNGHASFDRESPVVPTDSIVINRLIIKGNNDNYTRGYVKGKLRFDLGKRIEFKRLEQGIINLSATENFNSIRYKLLSNGNGEDLILNLNETPDNTLLRLGAHYDDLYKSAALINVTRKRILSKDDLASLDFVLGDNLRYFFKYYVDKGTYWSFGINSSFNAFDHEVNYDLIRSNFDVENDPNINSISLDVTDVTTQIYLQTVLREEVALTVGGEHKFLKYSTRTLGDIAGNEELEEARFSRGRTLFERSNFYSAFGQLTLDTYDDRYFPTKGLYFKGDFHLYLFSSDFNNNFREFSIGQARLGTAFPIWDGLSLNLESEGGVKFGTSEVTSFDFVLGGFGANMINNFRPFIGYDFLSLPGNSYVKAYARLDWEFTQKHHFTFTANYANVDDDLFRTGDWFTEPNFSGYGLGYGWESFLGPVQLLYSWSPELSDNTFFFSVGYWF
ncbi:MAG: patatin-like phospholipase family protein [Bacteroidota bacterium]